ncbi:hypothetical protein SBADM41S_01529 [Streptomyces badius]
MNRSHPKIRALGEQPVATLTSWRLPRKLRHLAIRVAGLVQSILTLHLASSE